jgi:hypothetical protein
MWYVAGVANMVIDKIPALVPPIDLTIVRTMVL